MPGEHTCSARVTWTGKQGAGATTYKTCGRDYDIDCAGKPLIHGSADPATAERVHAKARATCFFTRSANIRVEHEVEIAKE